MNVISPIIVTLSPAPLSFTRLIPATSDPFEPDFHVERGVLPHCCPIAADVQLDYLVIVHFSITATFHNAY